MYLGAKHMVTGYDHLLFILAIIFFLHRMRDVVIYVTLFSIGHSITLMAGVLLENRRQSVSRGRNHRPFGGVQGV